MQRTIEHKSGTNGVTNGITNGVTNGVNGAEHTNGIQQEPLTLELDALIVGAGFAGVYLLHRLRQEGFDVKIAEAGTGLGGVWHWNSYPGARVDSEYPVYALSIPEVFNTWTWEQRYPGEKELKRYFQHVDRVLHISKDVLYKTRVVAATFVESMNKWDIECENGTHIIARFFLGCLGFAAKRYYPDWPGLDTFKGYKCHSSFWPAEGVDMKGKKVAVIGTGATGIQIAQETAKEAEHLTCFVRTPNLCIPMRQGPIDPAQARKDVDTLQHLLSTKRFDNLSGFLYPNAIKNLWDDTPEEREALFEEDWQYGGFKILFCYDDILKDVKANRILYDFWARKQRARMNDTEKRDLLVPLEWPHPFAGKRPSLEQDYYEQMDKPHVTLVNVKKTPISHVTENGIVTADGRLHEVDVIAIATGFDCVTGPYKDIEFTGLNGMKLADKWRMGTYTYLGLSTANMPNFLYTYGPQSPTAYSNGPTLVEAQGEFILEVMKRMRASGKTRLNANEDVEQEWKKMISSTHATSVRDKVDGWYMGTNIPGKPREALNYSDGVPLYMKAMREVLDQDLKGFTIT